MKKEERYANAIECIKEIKSGGTNYILSLWRLLLPEASHYSARLLSNSSSRLCDLDDMMQESYFALLKALDTVCFINFDLDNLYQFIAYYKWCIRGQTDKIRGVGLKHDPMLNPLSLDQRLGDGESDDDDYHRYIPDESAEEDIRKKEHQRYLSELKKAFAEYDSFLDPLEIKVIHMRYYEGKSTPEIAEAINRNTGYVNTLEHSAFLKYRTAYHGIDLKSFLISGIW